MKKLIAILIVTASALAIWLSPIRYFSAGSNAPSDLIVLANCKHAGTWTFEEAVWLWHTENGVKVRPFNPAKREKPLLRIADSVGCSIDGKVIDIRYPPDRGHPTIDMDESTKKSLSQDL